MTVVEIVRRNEQVAKQLLAEFGVPYSAHRRRHCIKMQFRAHYAHEALKQARKEYLAALPWDDEDWSKCEPQRLAKIAADEKWERLKRYR